MALEEEEEPMFGREEDVDIDVGDTPVVSSGGDRDTPVVTSRAAGNTHVVTVSGGG